MSEVWATHEGFAGKSKPKLYRHIKLTNTTNTNLIQANEGELDKVVFNTITFNSNASNKPILFLICLVEFGCESLLPHYFLPSFKVLYKSYHIVAISWKGRDVFYRNYVDELWTIDDSCSYLRDYVLAFNSVSKNIKNIENCLGKYGKVYKSSYISHFFLENKCLNCGDKFYDNSESCQKCKSLKILKSFIESPKLRKASYVQLNCCKDLPDDLNLKFEHGKKYIGIFARKRKTYGRNLPPEFYKKFMSFFDEKGYRFVWLGEKQSSLNCPIDGIFDFTTSKYADNVEVCTAVVARCCATFQAWTASTRLSMLAKVPFCLVESYDQIFGKGQEGKRIELLSDKNISNKFLICNYLRSIEHLDEFTDFCIEKFLNFIEDKNSDIVQGFL
jgi:hypothetical protein